MVLQTGSVDRRVGPAESSGRLRGLGLRLALFGGSLLMPFLMLEIGLRLLGYSDHSIHIVNERGEGAYLYDPELKYRLKRSFEGRVRRTEFDTRFGTNAQGFRNDFDFDVANERTVFFMGDSFVAGLGVEAEDAIAARAAEMLPGRPVYNLGVPGYTAYQHALLLDRLSVTYPPELVVLFFYMGNDLQEECGLIERGIDENGFRSDRHVLRTSLRAAIRNLAARSRALIFLRARTKALVGRVWSRSSYERSAWLPFYGVGDPATTAPCYDRVAASLERVRDLALHRGFSIAIVLIAAPQQVSEARRTKLHERFESFDPYRINSGMLALCADLSIDCLDLTWIFTEAERKSPVHHPSDGHWNAAGHRLGAASVVEYLEVQGLLGPDSERP